MSVHPSARIDFAKTALLAYLQGLTLHGSPTVLDAEVAVRQGAAPPPYIRVTFDELDPTPAGCVSATQSALRMGLLLTCDLFWDRGGAAASLSPHAIDQAASELRAGLTYLSLAFYDYTVPASPVLVEGAVLRVLRPPTLRRVEPSGNLRRRRVQATVDWMATFDDFRA